MSDSNYTYQLDYNNIVNIVIKENLTMMVIMIMF